MGLLIRTLLIWLLVLAVPAQGAAAAIMAFCGPYHHGAAAASHTHRTSPVGHPEDVKHASHADSVHAHQDIAAVADEDEASAVSAGSGKVVHADQQKCSACAACCSFGAILSTVLAVPAPAVTPTVFSAVVPTVDAFAADGPERPPRIVLA